MLRSAIFSRIAGVVPVSLVSFQFQDNIDYITVGQSNIFGALCVISYNINMVNGILKHNKSADGIGG